MPVIKEACKKCGVEIYMIPMLIGGPQAVNKGKVVIASKIKEEVWVTNTGFRVHECRAGVEALASPPKEEKL